MKVIDSIKNVNLNPGEVIKTKILLAVKPDGTKKYMPIIIGQGAKSGPTLLLTSLIHGIEIGGYETIRKLFKELDFQEIRGRVIAVPVVNPFALNVADRYTPQDSADLNRVFPGDPEGTLSQRIAHVLIEKITKYADYVIDFHSCNPPSEFFTIASDEGSEHVRETSWNMAEAFGAVTVSPNTVSPGTFSSYLATIDKPSITPELVFSRRFDQSSEIGMIGTMNVMKHLKMIEGHFKPLPNTLPFKDRLKYAVANANSGGFIYFHKDVGESIAKDQVFATIKDPWGERVGELRSPVTGIIIAFPMSGNQAVTTGDKVAYFAYKV